MLHTCLHLAAALAALTAQPQDDAPFGEAPPVDPMAAIAPTDATIVVRFASYERFAEAFSTLDAAMAPEAGGVDPADAFGDIVPFMDESVRTDAPMLITFDALVDFGVTYVLPVDDVDAYAEQLVDEFGIEGVERGDGYVGFNPARSYTAGGNPLVAELGDRTVTAAVDLAAILEQYGPLVEMGIDGMRSEIAPLEDELGIDVDAILDLYVDGFAALGESATVLRAGLEVNGDTLEFHGEIATAPGSPLASFATDTRVSYGDNLYLDPGSVMQGVFGLDVEEAMSEHGDLIDGLLSVYTPETAQYVRDSVRVWAELAPSLGDVGTFSLRSLSPDEPLDAIYVYALDPDADGEDVVARYVEAITASSSPVAAFESMEPRMAGDLEFRRVRADFSGALEGEAGASQELLEAMLGGIVISVADRGDALLLHMGPEDVDLTDAAASVAEPVVVGQAIARALREIRAVTPAMVYSMDLTQMMRGFDPSMADADLPPAPLVFYGVVHEDCWAFGADVGISGIAAFAKAQSGLQEKTLPLGEPATDDR